MGVEEPWQHEAHAPTRYPTLHEVGFGNVFLVYLPQFILSGCLRVPGLYLSAPREAYKANSCTTSPARSDYRVIES